MIVDAFKIAVWIIERYDLHKDIAQYLDVEKLEIISKEEPVIVEKHKPYVITFNKGVVTADEIKDKIIKSTNTQIDDLQ